MPKRQRDKADGNQGQNPKRHIVNDGLRLFGGGPRPPVAYKKVNTPTNSRSSEDEGVIEDSLAQDQRKALLEAARARLEEELLALKSELSKATLGNADPQT